MKYNKKKLQQSRSIVSASVMKTNDARGHRHSRGFGFIQFDTADEVTWIDFQCLGFLIVIIFFHMLLPMPNSFFFVLFFVFCFWSLVKGKTSVCTLTRPRCRWPRISYDRVCSDKRRNIISRPYRQTTHAQNK